MAHAEVNRKNIEALAQQVERQERQIEALRLDAAEKRVLIEDLKETVNRLGGLVASVQALTMGTGPTAR